MLNTRISSKHSWGLQCYLQSIKEGLMRLVQINPVISFTNVVHPISYHTFFSTCPLSILHITPAPPKYNFIRSLPYQTRLLHTVSAEQMWCRKSERCRGQQTEIEEKGPWRQCGAAVGGQRGADDKWAVGRATIWPVAFHTLHFTTCAVLFMARLWRQLATVTDPKEHRAPSGRETDRDSGAHWFLLLLCTYY